MSNNKYSTYFYHIMKTGGKSIISSFLKHYADYEHNYIDEYGVQQCGLLSHHGNQEYKLPDFDYNKIYGFHWGNRMLPTHDFAHSHTNFSSVSIPPNTITITCIRDPLERLISHYKMLLFFKQRGIHTANIPSDNYEYVTSFEYFINNFPIKYLMHQLYFFSTSGNIEEAMNNITQCTQILLLDKLQEGFNKLYAKTQLQIYETKRINNTPIDHNLNSLQIQQLKNVLSPEYEFYHKILKYYKDN